MGHMLVQSGSSRHACRSAAALGSGPIKLSFTLLQFDVIMMDPPWQLATANPTRGVALGYSQVGAAQTCSVMVDL